MTDDDEDADRQRDRMLQRLGLVIDQAGVLEYHLRVLFCALMESPYAAIVAARQNAEWLIKNCKALVAANVRTEYLNENQATRINTSLKSCGDAIEARNNVVHGMWAIDGEAFLVGTGAWRSADLRWTPRTPADLQEIASRLGGSAMGIAEVMNRFLDSRRRGLESALRDLDLPGLGDKDPE